MNKHSKKALGIAIAAVIVIIACIAYRTVRPLRLHPSTEQTSVADFESATYQVEGQSVTLSTDGTTYFGNPVEGDFDGNGTPDIIFLLTQNPGGSGTFYYAALALGSTTGDYIGANAIFLGDRIAPQTSEYKDNVIVINYATRKDTEPMTATPSVGVSRYFKVTDGQLVEIK